MPYIHVSSNVPKVNVDAAAATRALTTSVAEALDVQEIYVMVQLDLEQTMLFQDSDAPCAMIQLRTIGKVDAEHNPKTVQSLTTTVVEALNVPASRVFINLDDIYHGNWGVGGAIVPSLS